MMSNITRSNTRTGALTSNYVKDNTNDLARLKTFLSKYEVTRNIYYNMQMGYSGLQIKVWRLRAAKKETGTYVLLCILGFALGFCLDIALVALFDSIGIYDLVSGAFYLLVLGACTVLPIPIYSKNLNKRFKKAEQELQAIVSIILTIISKWICCWDMCPVIADFPGNCVRMLFQFLCYLSK